jgi:DNA mismatch repair protein MSH2
LKGLVSKFDVVRARYQEAQEEIVYEALQIAQTYTSIMLAACQQIAQLDVLTTLAMIALKNDWVKPTLNLEMNDKTFLLKDIRHPLLEERIGSLNLVKNDVEISNEKYSCVISGPNAGGKSTYLKTIGLLVILNQIGSFVPCADTSIGPSISSSSNASPRHSPLLPIFDRIFFRSGSNDFSNLGISSFMLEMVELSEMLRSSSENSLLLIDELGRGTSTSDGFGLAWALLEELSRGNKSTNFIATHFYELNYLAASSPTTSDHTSSPSSSSSIHLDQLEYEELRRYSSPAKTSHKLPDHDHDPAHNQGSERGNCFRSVHVDAIVSQETRDVTMLYKILPGASNRSYGINVAKMVDFPPEIVQQAELIEELLTQQTNAAASHRKRKRSDEDEGDRER